MAALTRRRMLLSALGTGPVLAVAPSAYISAAASSDPRKVPRTDLATLLQTEQFNLKSDNGTEYVVQVGLPHAVDPDLPLMVRGRKPVTLFVLDGNENFGLVRDLTRMMQWGGDVPPCLVVGVTYPPQYLDLPVSVKNPRTYDLTPTAHGGMEDELPGASEGGGGPAYLKFLLTKLKPVIEQRYDVDNSVSVLIGHSLGGLFVIGAATQSHGGFRHYLALSPSLWWDQRFELLRFERTLKKGFHHDGRLAVYVGEREEHISGAYPSMVGDVIALKGVLENYPNAFEKNLIQVLPEEDHHTLQGTALSRGLRFLLS
ncbi:MAG: alpha/beta hydrolase [Proteobacteria bacterium]|nr:alpha/beta hydrolase [Pseudomonadota bacterium]